MRGYKGNRQPSLTFIFVCLMVIHYSQNLTTESDGKKSDEEILNKDNENPDNSELIDRPSSVSENSIESPEGSSEKRSSDNLNLQETSSNNRINSQKTGEEYSSSNVNDVSKSHKKFSTISTQQNNNRKLGTLDHENLPSERNTGADKQDAPHTSQSDHQDLNRVLESDSTNTAQNEISSAEKSQHNENEGTIGIGSSDQNSEDKISVILSPSKEASPGEKSDKSSELGKASSEATDPSRTASASSNSEVDSGKGGSVLGENVEHVSGLNVESTSKDETLIGDESKSAAQHLDEQQRDGQGLNDLSVNVGFDADDGNVTVNVGNNTIASENVNDSTLDSTAQNKSIYTDVQTTAGEGAGDINGTEGIGSEESSELNVSSGGEEKKEEVTSVEEEIKVETKHQDLPSFDEWRQKEQEKNKNLEALNQQQTQPVSGQAKVKVQQKQVNYAAVTCGAKVVASNPEAQNSVFILFENRDQYMINPCSAKKVFTVELCESVQVHTIELGNLELFSSLPKKFDVHASDKFPTKEWRLLGSFEARDERTVQTFQVATNPFFAKYIRIDLQSHYGTEHFCPLSILRVGGSTVDEDDDVDERGGVVLGEDMIMVEVEGGDSVDSEHSAKNLFTSATDTVMSLVKTVLKPMSGGSESDKKQNTSSVHDTTMSSATDSTDSILNINHNESDAFNSSVASSPDVHLNGSMNGSDMPLKEVIYLNQSIKAAGNHCITSPNRHSEFSIRTHISTSLDSLMSGTLPHYNNDEIDLVESLKLSYSDDKKLKKSQTTSLPRVTHYERDCFLCSSYSAVEYNPVCKWNKASVCDYYLVAVNCLALPKSGHLTASELHVPGQNGCTNEKRGHGHRVAAGGGRNMEGSGDLSSSSNQLDIGLVIDEEKLTAKFDSQTKAKIIENAESSSSDEPNVKINDQEQSTGVKEADTLGTASTDRQPASDSSQASNSDITADKTVESSLGGASALDSAVQSSESEQGILSPDSTEDNASDASSSATVTIDSAAVSSDLESQEFDDVTYHKLTSRTKESIFVKLKNRIKDLEVNLNLSNRYLEELSQRYKLQMDEMYTSLNKTIARLSSTAKSVDEKDRKQSDRIGLLEVAVGNLSDAVLSIQHLLDTFQSQMVTQHVLLMIAELLFFMLIIKFSSRASRDPPSCTNSSFSQSCESLRSDESAGQILGHLSGQILGHEQMNDLCYSEVNDENSESVSEFCRIHGSVRHLVNEAQVIDLSAEFAADICCDNTYNSRNLYPAERFENRTDLCVEFADEICYDNMYNIRQPHSNTERRIFDSKSQKLADTLQFKENSECMYRRDFCDQTSRCTRRRMSQPCGSGRSGRVESYRCSTCQQVKDYLSLRDGSLLLRSGSDEDLSVAQSNIPSFDSMKQQQKFSCSAAVENLSAAAAAVSCVCDPVLSNIEDSSKTVTSNHKEVQKKQKKKKTGHRRCSSSLLGQCCRSQAGCGALPRTSDDAEPCLSVTVLPDLESSGHRSLPNSQQTVRPNGAERPIGLGSVRPNGAERPIGLGSVRPNGCGTDPHLSLEDSYRPDISIINSHNSCSFNSRKSPRVNMSCPDNNIAKIISNRDKIVTNDCENNPSSNLVCSRESSIITAAFNSIGRSSDCSVLSGFASCRSSEVSNDTMPSSAGSFSCCFSSSVQSDSDLVMPSIEPVVDSSVLCDNSEVFCRSTYVMSTPRMSTVSCTDAGLNGCGVNARMTRMRGKYNIDEHREREGFGYSNGSTRENIGHKFDAEVANGLMDSTEIEESNAVSCVALDDITRNEKYLDDQARCLDEVITNLENKRAKLEEFDELERNVDDSCLSNHLIDVATTYQNCNNNANNCR